MSKIDHQIVGISVGLLIFLYLESLGYCSVTIKYHPETSVTH